MTAEPVKIASDIQASISVEECEKIAESCRGKVVLEIGSDKGRLTIALGSVAQRVHSLDDHGGDNPFGNTLTDFIMNVKRYRVLDRVVVHIGAMDKCLVALDKAIFHTVVVHGTKAAKVLVSSPQFFDSLLKRPTTEIYLHSMNEHDGPTLLAFANKNQWKKLTDRLMLVTAKGKTSGDA